MLSGGGSALSGGFFSSEGEEEEENLTIQEQISRMQSEVKRKNTEKIQQKMKQLHADAFKKK